MYFRSDITLEELVEKPKLIAYDTKQTEEKQMAVAKVDPSLLGFMTDPPKNVVLECIRAVPKTVIYAFNIIKPDKLQTLYDIISVGNADDASLQKAIAFVEDEDNQI